MFFSNDAFVDIVVRNIIIIIIIIESYEFLVEHVVINTNK